MEGKLTAKHLSPDEQKKQIKEVFPDGVKSHLDLEQAKELLRAAFAAIIKDPAINENDSSEMGENTRKALLALYVYAKPKSEHKTGLVFDVNFYAEALKMYEEQISHFQNWYQHSFWCIRVEEWLAGCLGTAYLRPHSQGIGNTSHRRGCLLADGSSYFSFHRPFGFVLGSHHFVGYYGLAWVRAMPAMGRLVGTAGLIRNLCRATTRAGTDFMQQYSQTEVLTCLVR